MLFKKKKDSELFPIISNPIHPVNFELKADSNKMINGSVLKVRDQIYHNHFDNSYILSKRLFFEPNSKIFRNDNMLVIGGAGSGKDACIVSPNILQANSNFIAIDYHGELLHKHKDYLISQGYKIKTLNLVDATKSNYYNPFALITSEEDIFDFVNILVASTDNHEQGIMDPFWRCSDINLLNVLFLYIWHTYPKQQQTMSNVLDLLTKLAEDGNNETKSALETFFADEKNKHLEDAINQYKVFRAQNEKVLKSIFISTAIRLQIFNLKPIKEITTVNDFNIKELSNSKCAIFIILSCSDNCFNSIANMFINQVYCALYKERLNKDVSTLPHVRIFNDESVHLKFDLPCISFAKVYINEFNTSICMIIQSLPVFKYLYKDYKTYLLCYNHIVSLGTRDSSTIEFLEKEINDLEPNNLKTNKRLPLMNELYYLPDDKCVCIIRNHFATIDDKLFYKDHPKYSE